MVDATARGQDVGRQVLFGLEIAMVTLDDVVNRCARAIETRTRLTLGVVNAAKVVQLRSDRLLRESLLDCDLILADGQSVVWASRLLHRPLPERVTGIDLFVALLELADREHRSIFLLGARAEVLADLVSRISTDYPGLRVAGSRDGYFTEAQSPDIAAQIRTSGADMLFLGMVSPKKEIFLGTHGPTLGVPVLHGVGGSFDVLAGVVRRAPERWQRLGLEWAYRLLQEPRRLWRRYLVTNTSFVLLVVRERLRPQPSYARPAHAPTHPRSKDA